MPKPEETTHDLRGPMRELREYARGALDVAHRDVSPVAGLIEDEEVLDLLLFAEQEYQAVGDMPPTLWETTWAQEIVMQQATRAATRAVREGDQSMTSFLTGIPSYRRDVSGMDGVDDIEDWLLHSENCKLIYLAALMGAGKTSFAIKCMQIVERHYRRAAKVARETDGLDESSVPVPEIACNFWVEPPPTARVDFVQINRYDQLVDWMERGSHDDVRWFWFDEASSILTAQDGENAQRVARMMGALVKKMRKNGVDMGTIGHDRGDVHILFRTMADFVDKESLKEVTVYRGIQDRKPTDPMFSLRGIPDVETWDWDTEDMADWEWTESAEEIHEDEIDQRQLKQIEEERVAMLLENIPHLRGTDLADIYDVDASTISRWKDRGSKRIDNGDSVAYPNAPAIAHAD